MPRKKFKCTACDRSFSMAAHLARHMNSTHGSPQKRGAAKRKRRAKRRAKAARGGNVAARRLGRPPSVRTRMGLHSMSLDQLAEVISAAKVEAKQKIAEIERLLK